VIRVTAVRNGGGVSWTNTFTDLNQWATAVKESHPDDQLWEPLDQRVIANDYPTTEEWVEVANEIVESDAAVHITIEAEA